MSRFGLAYLLAKNNVLKESVLSVCAPNGKSGKAPDIDDVQLLSLKDSGKWGVQIIGAMADRDSNVMDGITAVRS